MTKELTKILWEKYPKIFQGRYKSLQESLIPFGFECNNGWYWLIDNLCSNLQWNTDNAPERYPQIVASQVKEKFGSLCFYVESATDTQYAMISLAESLSYHICEKCGSTKDVSQTKGWIYTECPDCRFKRENRMSREPYLFWLLLSPKTGWWTRRYVFEKILNNIYKPLKSIYTKIITHLTTFKR